MHDDEHTITHQIKERIIRWVELKSLIGSGYALDLDRAYERGLALMVDGISSRLSRTR